MNKSAQDRFAKRIKNLRKRNEMTREDLASRLGVSAQTIYRWERGQRPRSEFLRRELEKLEKL